MRKMTFLTIAAALMFAGFVGLTPVQAQSTLSKDELLKLLQNKVAPKTLTTREVKKRQRNRIVIENATRTPSAAADNLDQLAAIANDDSLGSANLTVYFDYDSSTLTPQGIKTLIPLGQALSDPSLQGNTFLIGGHTDAKGGDAYNQKLSQRRADAVKQFLVTTFNIPSSKLVAAGFGEKQLKNARNPAAAENRRVQVVNVTQ